DCVRHLEESGLREEVLRAAREKPMFGVCIGAQMLFERSAEGDTPGLGLLAGEVVRFDPRTTVAADGARLKVPHMGWNRVRQLREHPVWAGIPDETYFYFVHSYHFAPGDPRDCGGDCEYGRRFTCAVARDNIFATQIHPEKRSGHGLKLNENVVGRSPKAHPTCRHSPTTPETMLLIPAIDIKDGRCVRLRQGVMEDETVFSEDPVAMAVQWIELGARRLHLVDLDGAVGGKPKNQAVIRDIVDAVGEDVPVQLGGGIRDLDTMESYLDDGLSYLIIGTAAVRDPGLLHDACGAFPGRILVGLDAREGKVATDGW